MAKVTSKLQVTLPKALASDLGIQPGDEIRWTAAAGGIRITPVKGKKRLDVKRRLALFDQATRRQKSRENRRNHLTKPRAKKRGWTREELYRRGGAS